MPRRMSGIQLTTTEESGRATNSKTFAFGTLEENGDTWLLKAPDSVIFLDVALKDGSLEHKEVSVVGKMGVPKSAPGMKKLIVKKLASHDDIAKLAYATYQSDPGRSPEDNWLQAERELLGG